MRKLTTKKPFVLGRMTSLNSATHSAAKLLSFSLQKPGLLVVVVRGAARAPG